MKALKLRDILKMILSFLPHENTYDPSSKKKCTSLGCDFSQIVVNNIISFCSDVRCSGLNVFVLKCFFFTFCSKV